MSTQQAPAQPEQGSRPIHIERKFRLSLEQVWKAWSDEEQFQKWWGPNQFTCPYASIDFIEGGKYLSCMRGRDGSEFWSTGTYKEIIPKERITFSDSFADKKGNVIPASEVGMPGEWPLELEVSLEFEEEAEFTKMSLTHLGIPAEMYEDCMKGWNESFDKMEKTFSHK